MASINIDISKRFMIFSVSVMLLMGFIGWGYATEGQFNLPLAWVLDNSGASVDNDGDGVIDNSEHLEGLSSSDLIAAGGGGEGFGSNLFYVYSDCPEGNPLDTTAICSKYNAIPVGIAKGDLRSSEQMYVTTQNPNCIAGNDYYVLCSYQEKSAPYSAKRIFVTSRVYQGDLGGEAGADQKCQERADVAGIGGTFKAFLLDGNGQTDIEDKFQDSAYVNMAGQIAFVSFYDYMGGISGFWNLEHAIDYDEFGRSTTSTTGISSAWTGLDGNGNFCANNCNKFTSSGMTQGNYGNIITTNSDWYSEGWHWCSGYFHLICLET